MKKRKMILFIALLSICIYIPKVNAMQISVKKPSMETITVEVESSDTIEAVKEKIYQIDNSFLIENQRLIFGGTEMEDGRTLADYEVEKENVIELHLKQYKVVFDANGGTFVNGDTLIIEKWEIGMETTLESPTREGYKFLGYYTENTGGTKLELILAESGIDSDMTFYAQWEENLVQTPLEPEIENPKTFDGIGNSIIIGIISLISLNVTVIYLNKVRA